MNDKITGGRPYANEFIRSPSSPWLIFLAARDQRKAPPPLSLSLSLSLSRCLSPMQLQIFRSCDHATAPCKGEAAEILL